MYVCMFVYVCMYVCMYVYVFNKQSMKALAQEF